MALGAVLAMPGVQRRLGEDLPQQVPLQLGRFLFWWGVPISILSFMRRVDLAGTLLAAPLVAWGAMLLGLVLANGLWRQGGAPPRRGSFVLAAMLGNTGYIGYPVVLLLPQLGLNLFGWALFYDILGTVLGSYGLGAILASEWGEGRPPQGWQEPAWRRWSLEVLRSPNIAAFGLGILIQPVPLPVPLEMALRGAGWGAVALSLVLMGLRLQQLRSGVAVVPACGAVAIKMVVVPLIIGGALTVLGVVGPVRLVLVVQSAMPCAFATLVLAEAYGLDRNLSVTCVGLSSALLLVTLPLWLWLFAV